MTIAQHHRMYSVFFLFAIALGGLLSRLPDLQRSLGVTESQLGLTLIGMGTSVIFPLAMSAAAQRTDRPAAINVAALAQTSFVTFLVAPPLLGFVAEHWGIRWSFGIGMPFVILSFLMAGALGARPVRKEVPAE